ncbi:uncharacterized protein LOC110059183 [Orbicella faveolata]|uniref:uncharacterized protein LOC110059183 n=1 Tax=Orbicella faveolata TaxID=48498 RepID=UPI0009E4CA59|nr:uncharacterized protein LOC110059183 [Orbicella faveolata]
MYEALYMVCSALFISVVIWLLNPFEKLHNLLRYLLKGNTDHPEGVRSFDEIPGPWGLPYFGDDAFSFVKTVKFDEQMAALRDAFAKYGPIFKKTVMGRTVVFFEDPSDVEAVFKGDGRFPVRSDDLFKPQREYMNSRKLPEGLASL